MPDPKKAPVTLSRSYEIVEMRELLSKIRTDREIGYFHAFLSNDEVMLNAFYPESGEICSFDNTLFYLRDTHVAVAAMQDLAKDLNALFGLKAPEPEAATE